MVGDHLVTGDGVKPGPERAAVFHAHVFSRIKGVEGPEIDDLIAVRVDDFYSLAFGEAVGFAGAGGDEMLHECARWQIIAAGARRSFTITYKSVAHSREQVRQVGWTVILRRDSISL